MKIVQIATVQFEEEFHVLYALTEDGTIWQNWISILSGPQGWRELRALPQKNELETIP